MTNQIPEFKTHHFKCALQTDLYHECTQDSYVQFKDADDDEDEDKDKASAWCSRSKAHTHKYTLSRWNEPCQELKQLFIIS